MTRPHDDEEVRLKERLDLENKLRELQGRVAHKCGANCEDERHNDVSGTA